MNPSKKIHIDTHLCDKCKLYKRYDCLKNDGGNFSCKLQSCPTFEPSNKYKTNRRKVELNKYGAEMVSIAK